MSTANALVHLAQDPESTAVLTLTLTPESQLLTVTVIGDRGDGDAASCTVSALPVSTHFVEQVLLLVAAHSADGEALEREDGGQ